MLGTSDTFTCEGETIVVNLHGALITTSIPLREHMKIEVYVHMTDKLSNAEVVYVNPEHTAQCGIALARPQNIWGISLLPDDWYRDRQ